MKSCIEGENSGEDIVKMLEMVHYFFPINLVNHREQGDAYT